MWADIVQSFMPSELRMQLLEKAAQARRERLQAEPVQAWSDKLKWEPRLHIDAESYKSFNQPLFDSPVADVFSADHAVRHGEWGYQNVLLPKGEVLFTVLGTRKGDVVFNGDVVIPKIWHTRQTQVWMSLMPMEMLSQRPGIQKACGRVLVGGLGMGWALKQIAKRKNVTEILVAERSAEILDWFGRDLVKRVAAESGKLIRIVQDDAYEVARCYFDHCDSFIFDIWPGYGSARYDRDWKHLSNRAAVGCKVAWAWGASGAPKERT